MNQLGSSRALWVIAAVLAVFLILAIAFIVGSWEATPKVSVCTGPPTDRGGYTSMSVTLEGEPDSYTVILSGPDGETVDIEHVTLPEADGRGWVWVALAGYNLPAKPGNYLLSVLDGSGNEVFRENYSFSGPKLEVLIWGEPAWCVYFSKSITGDSHEVSYDIGSLPITFRNSGDLPAYLAYLEAKVGEVEYTGYFDMPIIYGRETRRVNAEFDCPHPAFSTGSLTPGTYEATYKVWVYDTTGAVSLFREHHTTIEL